MDADRFDRLTRRLTLPKASRRLALLAPLVVVGADIIGTDVASARKRCKQSNRCGKDCCSSDSCFPKKINPHDQSDFTLGCCPAAKLCKDPAGDPTKDQCCYPDEKCEPANPN